MENENIFELASRNKTRFAYKGTISTEDLWDLPLKSLDSIFMGLNAKRKACEGESLLAAKSADKSELDLQLALVRHVVGVKLAEMADRENDAARKLRDQKVMAILEERGDAKLKSLTDDELKNMLSGK